MSPLLLSLVSDSSLTKSSTKPLLIIILVNIKLQAKMLVNMIIIYYFIKVCAKCLFYECVTRVVEVVLIAMCVVWIEMISKMSLQCICDFDRSFSGLAHALFNALLPRELVIAGIEIPSFYPSLVMLFFVHIDLAHSAYYPERSSRIRPPIFDKTSKRSVF